ncbi:hypothetical protein A2999_02960 [Candidatus Wolfebacteria bacterium RIFCSPLOWO2_01_FULL_38_11]|uniref:Uncharacterized protein n=1 Tax=Candidatus Wolfebacteria bacterium RIFCSPLOWO2_01_FULL_38_11 TaxID=1802556 RepID=A0A1F8DS17_9BACT|nr:MAG: hypothetical protein A2999_02960 [Candidatus Wolfebacteria bacterium RIFCSPLOWO2_01_FULL_38_11]
MKKHSRKLFVFLAIIAIIGSGFYLYKNIKLTKALTYFLPFVNTVKEKASIKGEAVLDKTAKDFKNTAFAHFKSGVNSGIDKIGEAMGVEPINQINSNAEQSINDNKKNQETNKNCE